MLKRKLKRLEKSKLDLLNRLDNLHDSNADPKTKAMYQSDLQYRLLAVETEIEHEEMMLPFTYTLATFVVLVLGILVYFII